MTYGREGRCHKPTDAMDSPAPISILTLSMFNDIHSTPAGLAFVLNGDWLSGLFLLFYTEIRTYELVHFNYTSSGPILKMI